MNEDRLRHLELTVGSQPFSVVPELTEEIRALQAEVERLRADNERLQAEIERKRDIAVTALKDYENPEWEQVLVTTLRKIYYGETR